MAFVDTAVAELVAPPVRVLDAGIELALNAGNQSTKKNDLFISIITVDQQGLVALTIEINMVEMSQEARKS